MTKQTGMKIHPDFDVEEMEGHAARVYEVAENIWNEFLENAFGQDMREGVK